MSRRRAANSEPNLHWVDLACDEVPRQLEGIAQSQCVASGVSYRREDFMNSNAWRPALAVLTLFVVLPAPIRSEAQATLPCSGESCSKVIFESIRIVDRGGRQLSTRQTGALSFEDWRRAARP